MILDSSLLYSVRFYLCIALFVFVHCIAFKDFKEGNKERSTNPLLFFFLAVCSCISKPSLSVLLCKLRSSQDSTKRANQIEGIVAYVLHCIDCLWLL